MKKNNGISNLIGRNLIRLDNVDSTNSYAMRMVKHQPLTEGTVILADYQSAGRGQAGNQWQSDAGKNLTFSIVFYPKSLTVNRQFFLSMAVSGGIASFLQAEAIKAQVKWPNDICIGERKIAGILIENALQKDRILHSVTGIGLNVNQRDFPADIGHATSMLLENGMEYAKDEVLSSLLKHISFKVQQLYDGHDERLKAYYMDHLQYLGTWKWYTAASDRFEGKITDVAESGELMVMRRSGEIRPYAFKEITPCP